MNVVIVHPTYTDMVQQASMTTTRAMMMVVQDKT
jgi:hypothetical protein